MKRLGLLIALTICGCGRSDSPVTIVNIGNIDRIELGKLLRIINNSSPRVIALDFHLLTDSLGKDSILVMELYKARNTVQVISLHEPIGASSSWDSVEISHSKFKVGDYGFSNLVNDDSVIADELPMQQFYRNQPIYPFGYVVAQKYNGVKREYMNDGVKELQLDLRLTEKNYTLISSDDLFSGKFQAADINEGIVMMGYVGEEEDFFYLDDSKSEKINSVEVHAAIVSEIVSRSNP